MERLYEMDGSMIVDENERKHLDNPFYKAVEAYREQVRIGQILKGAHKYPEPFTTASWTSKEIIEHAMQENVDQAHYIYAAAERMEVLEKEISRLKERNEFLETSNCDLHTELSKRFTDLEYWKTRHQVEVNNHLETIKALEKVQRNMQTQEHSCRANTVIIWGKGPNEIKAVVCRECGNHLYDSEA